MAIKFRTFQIYATLAIVLVFAGVAAAATYVGVSVVDGKITFRISDVPFGYL